MNVLLINGSPHEKGCTYTALSLIAGELNKAGIDTEILHVGGKPVGGCIGCGLTRMHGLMIIRRTRLPQRQWLRVRRRGQRGH